MFFGKNIFQSILAFVQKHCFVLLGSLLLLQSCNYGEEDCLEYKGTFNTFSQPTTVYPINKEVLTSGSSDYDLLVEEVERMLDAIDWETIENCIKLDDDGLVDMENTDVETIAGLLEGVELDGFELNPADPNNYPLVYGVSDANAKSRWNTYNLSKSDQKNLGIQFFYADAGSNLVVNASGDVALKHKKTDLVFNRSDFFFKKNADGSESAVPIIKFAPDTFKKGTALLQYVSHDPEFTYLGKKFNPTFTYVVVLPTASPSALGFYNTWQCQTGSDFYFQNIPNKLSLSAGLTVGLSETVDAYRQPTRAYSDAVLFGLDRKNLAQKMTAHNADDNSTFSAEAMSQYDTSGAIFGSLYYGSSSWNESSATLNSGSSGISSQKYRLQDNTNSAKEGKPLWAALNGGTAFMFREKPMLKYSYAFAGEDSYNGLGYNPKKIDDPGVGMDFSYLNSITNAFVLEVPWEDKKAKRSDTVKLSKLAQADIQDIIAQGTKFVLPPEALARKHVRFLNNTMLRSPYYYNATEKDRPIIRGIFTNMDELFYPSSMVGIDENNLTYSNPIKLSHEGYNKICQPESSNEKDEGYQKCKKVRDVGKYYVAIDFDANEAQLGVLRNLYANTEESMYHSSVYHPVYQNTLFSPKGIRDNMRSSEEEHPWPLILEYEPDEWPDGDVGDKFWRSRSLYWSKNCGKINSDYSVSTTCVDTSTRYRSAISTFKHHLMNGFLCDYIYGDYNTSKNNPVGIGLTMFDSYTKMHKFKLSGSYPMCKGSHSFNGKHFIGFKAPSDYVDAHHYSYRLFNPWTLLPQFALCTNDYRKDNWAASPDYQYTNYKTRDPMSHWFFSPTEESCEDIDDSLGILEASHNFGGMYNYYIVNSNIWWGSPKVKGSEYIILDDSSLSTGSDQYDDSSFTKIGHSSIITSPLKSKCPNSREAKNMDMKDSLSQSCFQQDKYGYETESGKYNMFSSTVGKSVGLKRCNVFEGKTKKPSWLRYAIGWNFMSPTMNQNFLPTTFVSPLVHGDGFDTKHAYYHNCKLKFTFKNSQSGATESNITDLFDTNYYHASHPHAREENISIDSSSKIIAPPQKTFFGFFGMPNSQFIYNEQDKSTTVRAVAEEYSDTSKRFRVDKSYNSDKDQATMQGYNDFRKIYNSKMQYQYAQSKSKYEKVYILKNDSVADLSRQLHPHPYSFPVRGGINPHFKTRPGTNMAAYWVNDYYQVLGKGADGKAVTPNYELVDVNNNIGLAGPNHWKFLDQEFVQGDSFEVNVSGRIEKFLPHAFFGGLPSPSKEALDHNYKDLTDNFVATNVAKTTGHGNNPYPGSYKYKPEEMMSVVHSVADDWGAIYKDCSANFAVAVVPLSFVTCPDSIDSIADNGECPSTVTDHDKYSKIQGQDGLQKLYPVATSTYFHQEGDLWFKRIYDNDENSSSGLTNSYYPQSIVTEQLSGDSDFVKIGISLTVQGLEGLAEQTDAIKDPSDPINNTPVVNFALSNSPSCADGEFMLVYIQEYALDPETDAPVLNEDSDQYLVQERLQPEKLFEKLTDRDLYDIAIKVRTETNAFVYDQISDMLFLASDLPGGLITVPKGGLVWTRIVDPVGEGKEFDKADGRFIAFKSEDENMAYDVYPPGFSRQEQQEEKDEEELTDTACTNVESYNMGSYLVRLSKPKSLTSGVGTGAGGVLTINVVDSIIDSLKKVFFEGLDNRIENGQGKSLTVDELEPFIEKANVDAMKITTTVEEDNVFETIDVNDYDPEICKTDLRRSTVFGFASDINVEEQIVGKGVREIWHSGSSLNFQLTDQSNYLLRDGFLRSDIVEVSSSMDNDHTSKTMPAENLNTNRICQVRLVHGSTDYHVANAPDLYKYLLGESEDCIVCVSNPEASFDDNIAQGGIVYSKIHSLNYDDCIASGYDAYIGEIVFKNSAGKYVAVFPYALNTIDYLKGTTEDGMNEVDAKLVETRMSSYSGTVELNYKAINDDSSRDISFFQLSTSSSGAQRAKDILLSYVNGDKSLQVNGYDVTGMMSIVYRDTTVLGNLYYDNCEIKFDLSSPNYARKYCQMHINGLFNSVQEQWITSPYSTDKIDLKNKNWFSNGSTSLKVEVGIDELNFSAGDSIASYKDLPSTVVYDQCHEVDNSAFSTFTKKDYHYAVSKKYLDYGSIESPIVIEYKDMPEEAFLYDQAYIAKGSSNPLIMVSSKADKIAMISIATPNGLTELSKLHVTQVESLPDYKLLILANEGSHCNNEKANYHCPAGSGGVYILDLLSGSYSLVHAENDYAPVVVKQSASALHYSILFLHKTRPDQVMTQTFEFDMESGTMSVASNNITEFSKRNIIDVTNDVYNFFADYVRNSWNFKSVLSAGDLEMVTHGGSVAADAFEATDSRRLTWNAEGKFYYHDATMPVKANKLIASKSADLGYDYIFGGVVSVTDRAVGMSYARTAYFSKNIDSEDGRICRFGGYIQGARAKRDGSNLSSQFSNTVSDTKTYNNTWEDKDMVFYCLDKSHQDGGDGINFYLKPIGPRPYTKAGADADEHHVYFSTPSLRGDRGQEQTCLFADNHTFIPVPDFTIDNGGQSQVPDAGLFSQSMEMKDGSCEPISRQIRYAPADRSLEEFFGDSFVVHQSRGAVIDSLLQNAPAFSMFIPKKYSDSLQSDAYAVIFGITSNANVSNPSGQGYNLVAVKNAVGVIEEGGLVSKTYFQGLQGAKIHHYVPNDIMYKIHGARAGGKSSDAVYIETFTIANAQSNKADLADAIQEIDISQCSTNNANSVQYYSRYSHSSNCSTASKTVKAHENYNFASVANNNILMSASSASLHNFYYNVFSKQERIAVPYTKKVCTNANFIMTEERDGNIAEYNNRHEDGASKGFHTMPLTNMTVYDSGATFTPWTVRSDVHSGLAMINHPVNSVNGELVVYSDCDRDSNVKSKTRAKHYLSPFATLRHCDTTNDAKAKESANSIFYDLGVNPNVGFVISLISSYWTDSITDQCAQFGGGCKSREASLVTSGTLRTRKVNTKNVMFFNVNYLDEDKINYSNPEQAIRDADSGNSIPRNLGSVCNINYKGVVGGVAEYSALQNSVAEKDKYFPFQITSANAYTPVTANINFMPYKELLFTGTMGEFAAVRGHHVDFEENQFDSHFWDKAKTGLNFTEWDSLDRTIPYALASWRSKTGNVGVGSALNDYGERMRCAGTGDFDGQWCMDIGYIMPVYSDASKTYDSEDIMLQSYPEKKLARYGRKSFDADCLDSNGNNVYNKYGTSLSALDAQWQADSMNPQNTIGVRGFGTDDKSKRCWFSRGSQLPLTIFKARSDSYPYPVKFISSTKSNMADRSYTDFYSQPLPFLNGGIKLFVVKNISANIAFNKLNIADNGSGFSYAAELIDEKTGSVTKITDQKQSDQKQFGLPLLDLDNNYFVNLRNRNVFYFWDLGVLDKNRMKIYTGAADNRDKYDTLVPVTLFSTSIDNGNAELKEVFVDNYSAKDNGVKIVSNMFIRNKYTLRSNAQEICAEENIKKLQNFYADRISAGKSSYAASARDASKKMIAISIDDSKQYLAIESYNTHTGAMQKVLYNNPQWIRNYENSKNATLDLAFAGCTLAVTSSNPRLNFAYNTCINKEINNFDTFEHYPKEKSMSLNMGSGKRLLFSGGMFHRIDNIGKIMGSSDNIYAKYQLASGDSVKKIIPYNKDSVVIEIEVDNTYNDYWIMDIITGDRVAKLARGVRFLDLSNKSVGVLQGFGSNSKIETYDKKTLSSVNSNFKGFTEIRSSDKIIDVWSDQNIVYAIVNRNGSETLVIAYHVSDGNVQTVLEMPNYAATSAIVQKTKKANYVVTSGAVGNLIRTAYIGHVNKSNTIKHHISSNQERAVIKTVEPLEDGIVTIDGNGVVGHVSFKKNDLSAHKVFLANKNILAHTFDHSESGSSVNKLITTTVDPSAKKGKAVLRNKSSLAEEFSLFSVKNEYRQGFKMSEDIYPKDYPEFDSDVDEDTLSQHPYFCIQYNYYSKYFPEQGNSSFELSDSDGEGSLGDDGLPQDIITFEGRLVKSCSDNVSEFLSKHFNEVSEFDLSKIDEDILNQSRDNNYFYNVGFIVDGLIESANIELSSTKFYKCYFNMPCFKNSELDSWNDFVKDVDYHNDMISGDNVEEIESIELDDWVYDNDANNLSGGLIYNFTTLIIRNSLIRSLAIIAIIIKLTKDSFVNFVKPLTGGNIDDSVEYASIDYIKKYIGSVIVFIVLIWDFDSGWQLYSRMCYAIVDFIEGLIGIVGSALYGSTSNPSQILFAPLNSMLELFADINFWRRVWALLISNFFFLLFLLIMLFQLMVVFMLEAILAIYSYVSFFFVLFYYMTIGPLVFFTQLGADGDAPDLLNDFKETIVEQISRVLKLATTISLYSYVFYNILKSAFSFKICYKIIWQVRSAVVGWWVLADKPPPMLLSLLEQTNSSIKDTDYNYPGIETIALLWIVAGAMQKQLDKIRSDSGEDLPDGVQKIADLSTKLTEDTAIKLAAKKAAKVAVNAATGGALKKAEKARESASRLDGWEDLLESKRAYEKNLEEETKRSKEESKKVDNPDGSSAADKPVKGNESDDDNTVTVGDEGKSINEKDAKDVEDSVNKTADKLSD